MAGDARRAGVTGKYRLPPLWDDVSIRTGGTGTRRMPAGPLAVDEFAYGCVDAALQAGALLQGELTGHTPVVTLAAEQAAAVVRAERYSTLDGADRSGGFAPLSRFWPTSDGWLRTHANYPWHAAALERVTGAGDDPDAVAAVLASASAVDWESRIVAAGGVAAAVRTRPEWAAHPAGAALAAAPLVGHRRIGDAPAVRPASLHSVRVLDLTRVLAGPAATRLLGALGADVLRIDAPARPELDFHRVDGVIGKRSTLLDLAGRSDRDRFAALLAEADVLVYGYRPGSAAAGELSELAAAYPGLVVAQLSAWGTTGPWAGRRGFDSLVQAASGIADLLGAGGRPGALPCQLLDHAAGYLLAASVLLALRERARTGGSHLLTVSLGATAEALLATPRLDLAEVEDVPAATVTLSGPGGAALTTVAAPGVYDGVPLQWPEPVSGYGADPATWR